MKKVKMLTQDVIHFWQVLLINNWKWVKHYTPWTDYGISPNDYQKQRQLTDLTEREVDKTGFVRWT